MGVSGLLNYAGDFRGEAVEASRVLLSPVAGDVEALAVSSCTRIDGADTEAACRRVQWALWLGSVFGIAMITLPPILIVAALLLDLIWLILVAIAVAAGMIVLTLIQIWRRTVQLRAIVVARGLELPPHARCVTIENALTYSSLKFVPEDMAILLMDAPRCRVRLEGLRHRYLIYAADVVSLSVRRGPAQSSTSVTYRSGSTTLSLTLAENQSNLLEMMKQTFGRAPRLHRMLCDVLTPPEDPPVLDAIVES